MMSQTTMCPEHPEWREFCNRLGGPEGCDFQKDDDGEITWKCSGGTDKSRAARILQAMGFPPKAVEQSCKYFEQHGGYCDCEILFNVDPRSDDGEQVEME